MLSLRGLYRGLLPGFVGVSHGAVQFMVYEEMKRTLEASKTSSLVEKEDFFFLV